MAGSGGSPLLDAPAPRAGSYPGGRWTRLAAGLALGAVLSGAGLGACAVRMPGASHRGPLPPASAEQEEIAARLAAHVRALAGERNLLRRPAELAAAADYVEGSLSGLGYAPVREPFPASGRTAHNVAAELPGEREPGRVVVVGAHYDTAPGTPGADDNASGVAALLELARLLRERPHDRTIRLVAFANEEPPFFATPEMGSAHDAAGRADVVAMLSLESLGYWRAEPGTQHYPWPFGLLYPDTGDFVAFVGTFRSVRLVRQSVGAFRAAEPYPAEGAALPGWITGVDWSDHRSYAALGWPSLMVTDTAVFRNPHYHEPTDRPETLDLARTARVVTGLRRVVEGLATAE